VAAMAAAAVMAAAATVTPVAAMAPVAPMSDELYVGLGCADMLLVENIERRQANVGDFLLTKCEVVILAGVPCRDVYWAELALRMPRSPATTTIQQRLTRVGLCSDAFAPKCASRLT
jgi:hypothetical protein